MSQKGKVIWTILVIGVLVTSFGYGFFLRPSPEQQPVVKSTISAAKLEWKDEHSKLLVPDEAWRKDVDAVYFFQLTGSNDEEKKEAWYRAYPKVFSEPEKENLKLVYTFVINYAERNYMCCIAGFHIPSERKGKLPQFLSADPPTNKGGRISECGWIKAK